MEDPRWPGYRHNIHSFFHRALDQMPWYRELELERRGARYGVATMCVGFGQAIAAVIERL